jgi:alpha-N-acetylglucosamine transferase
MDNFYYLSLAVIVVAIVLSLIISFSIYRESKKNEASFRDEIASFISQQSKQTIELQSLSSEIENLRAEIGKLGSHKTDSHLMPLLSAVVKRLENTPKVHSGNTSVKSSTTQEKPDEHSVFNHAIRLAKENQPAQKLVEICGIEPSEAELIVRMHSPKE